MDFTKLVLVIAHPDDELVTFGPVLMTAVNKGIPIHVILATNPNPARIADFMTVAKKVGFTYEVMMYDDNPNVGFRVDQLCHDMQLRLAPYGPDTLCVTHSPISGDLGNHVQHQTLALGVAGAYINATDAAEPFPTLQFRYYDGFCEKPIIYSTDAGSFESMLELLWRHYNDQVTQLPRETYPITSFVPLCTYSDSQLRRLVLKGAGGDDLTAFDLTHIEQDPWRTKNGYETYKSDWSGKLFAEYLRRQFGGREDVRVLDVGTGHGRTLDHTWKHMTDAQKVITRFSALELSEGYKEGLQQKPWFGHFYANDQQLKDTFDVLSIMQCLYYFEGDTLANLVRKVNPKMIYIETDSSDYAAPILTELGYRCLKAITHPVVLATYANPDELVSAAPSDNFDVGFFDGCGAHFWWRD